MTYHRHIWVRWSIEENGVKTTKTVCELHPVPVVQDEVRTKRGRTVRSYGNRAELAVARTYGGTKIGHMGGPVDVRGAEFDTQVRTHRRSVPVEWKKAINAMPGPRCPRILLRFVQPGGLPPEDWFVFRASDFLDWFGRDEVAATEPAEREAAR